MLMISDWMREQSCYDDALDGKGLRNMVVKVIGKRDGSSANGPTRYEVLSHAGVVITWPLQQEFRELGQDVDRDLKAREVTERMRSPSEKIGLMQAWDFFLERRRARHMDMASRQNELLSRSDGGIAPMVDTSSEISPEADYSGVDEPALTSAADAAAEPAVSKPALTLICCSCMQPIHLSAGREPAVCMGCWQQPMHSSSGTCKSSNRWVRVGRCSVLFPVLCGVACA